MNHKLSHSIGIEVHEPIQNNILKTNSVITIEPGINFRKCLLKDKNIIKKYINIGGVRIKDTIQVLDNGYKILNNIYKEINTLEKNLG